MKSSSNPDNSGEPKTLRECELNDWTKDDGDNQCSDIYSLPSELPRLSGYEACTSENVEAPLCSNVPISFAHITSEDISQALRAPDVPKLTVPPSDSPMAIKIEPDDFDEAEKTMECPMEFDDLEVTSQIPVAEERVTVQDLGKKNNSQIFVKCQPDAEQEKAISDGVSYCTDLKNEPHCNSLTFSHRLCGERGILENLELFLDHMSGDDSSLPCTTEILGDKWEDEEVPSWREL